MPSVCNYCTAAAPRVKCKIMLPSRTNSPEKNRIPDSGFPAYLCLHRACSQICPWCAGFSRLCRSIACRCQTRQEADEKDHNICLPIRIFQLRRTTIFPFDGFLSGLQYQLRPSRPLHNRLPTSSSQTEAISGAPCLNDTPNKLVDNAAPQDVPRRLGPVACAPARMSTKNEEVDSAGFARILTKQVKIGLPVAR